MNLYFEWWGITKSPVPGYRPAGDKNNYWYYLLYYLLILIIWLAVKKNIATIRCFQWQTSLYHTHPGQDNQKVNLWSTHTNSCSNEPWREQRFVFIFLVDVQWSIINITLERLICEIDFIKIYAGFFLHNYNSHPNIQPNNQRHTHNHEKTVEVWLR